MGLILNQVYYNHCVIYCKHLQIATEIRLTHLHFHPSTHPSHFLLHISFPSILYTSLHTSQSPSLSPHFPITLPPSTLPNHPPSVHQAQTYYSYEMITNYEKCVNETYNITDYNCSFIQSLIVDLNLDCVNATETNRHITLGTREGMNVLGIIVFSVSFAVVLSRMGTEGQRIVGVISTLNEVIMKLVTLVMW